MTFHYQNFGFFEYMQVLCTLGIKMLFFSSICRFGELQVLKPAYAQKKNKKMIVKSHQTCIYSTKQKNRNFRLYVGLTGIDELVFDLFDFF